MPAPKWGSPLSIFHGCLNPVPVSDLDQGVLKELMAKNGGLTLHELKKRSSQYPLVTTRSVESYDEVETPAISAPMIDANDNLSEIPTAIPPMNADVLTVKRNAFLAQLLMEEVDLDSTSVASHDHTALRMRPSDGPTRKIPNAKPSPNNMTISERDAKNMQHVLRAKAEGIERRTRLDLRKMAWKSSSW